MSSDSEKITDYKEYVRIILRFAGAHYLKVHLRMIQYLEGDGSAAVVISYMINQLTMKLQFEPSLNNLQENDMWFKCPIKEMMENLNMKKDKIQRILSDLVDKNLIERKRLPGNAPHYGNFLWVRVNQKKIELIDNGAQLRESRTTSDPQLNEVRETPTRMKCGKPPVPIYKRKNLNRTSKELDPPARPAASRNRIEGVCSSKPPAKPLAKTFGKKETSSPGRVIADRLLQILTKHRVLPKTAKPNLWHDVITKKMLPLWSKDYILKVLDWYDENFGNDFMPECYCGKSLAEKFEKLERKMLREVGPPKEEIKYTAEENDEFFGGKYWKPKLVHEEEKPISPYTEWEDDGNGDYSDYL